MEDRVDDRVFVRGKWIDVACEVINKLIEAPDYEQNDYFDLMD